MAGKKKIQQDRLDIPYSAVARKIALRMGKAVEPEPGVIPCHISDAGARINRTTRLLTWCKSSYADCVTTPFHEYGRPGESGVEGV